MKTCVRTLGGQQCAVPQGQIHNIHNNVDETLWWVTWKDDEYEVMQMTLPDGSVVKLKSLYEDEDVPNPNPSLNEIMRSKRD